MKLSQILLYFFLVFMAMWMCFWGYYIILEFMIGRKYIHYSLLLKEAFGDVIYPYIMVIMGKILFAKPSPKSNTIKREILMTKRKKDNNDKI